jgi:hypothetical protein
MIDVKDMVLGRKGLGTGDSCNREMEDGGAARREYRPPATRNQDSVQCHKVTRASGITLHLPENSS